MGRFSRHDCFQHKERLLWVIICVPAIFFAGIVAAEPSAPESSSPCRHHMMLGIAGGVIVGLSLLIVYMIFSQRRNARERAHSERQFHEIVESVNDWVWEVDQAGRYTFASGHVKELLGYAPSEIIGKTPFDLMPPEEAERVSPIFAEFVENKKPFENLENINLHRDGREVILETNGFPIYNENGQFIGYRGVDRDITERKKTERRTYLQQAELDSVFRASPVGVAVSAKRRLIRGNKRFYEITGYSEKELLKMEARQIYQTDQEYKKVGAQYAEAMINGTARIETQLIRKDQTVIDVVINIAPLDMKDENAGFVVIFQDITESVQSRQRYRNTIESSPMGILTYQLTADDQLVLTGSNPAVNAILEADITAFIGKTIEEVFPGLTHTSLPEDYRRICKEGGFCHGDNFAYQDERVSGLYEFTAFQTSPGEMAAMFLDVTDRMQNQQKLRDSEAALRKAQQIARLGFYDWDLQNNTVTASDGLKSFFGCKPDEQLTFEHVVESIHPDDRKQFVADDFESRTKGVPFSMDYRVVLPSGKIRWAHDQSEVTQDEDGNMIRMFGVIQDITGRKLAEKQLLFTQFAIDHTDEAAYWMGPDAKFTYVNNAACQVLGYTHDELLKINAFDISPDFPQEKWPDHWAELKKNGTIQLETVHRRKNGTDFPVAITANFVEYDGGEYNCAFVRDITEQKAAEQKRQALIQQIQNRNDELQSIVFTAAHDLRSPLVNIAGFTGEMEKALTALTEVLDNAGLEHETAERVHFLLKTDLAESLRLVKFGNQQMDMLLGGLMRVSRVGTTELKLATLDMNEMFAKVIRGFQYQINTIGIDISVQGNLPDCIGDYSLLAQVFINLLDNAIKYRHPQRKLVVEIGGTLRGEAVEYTIADNGIGIEPEHTEKVFDLFCQLERRQAGGGEGLGLTIVRRILDRQHGSARIDSTPGLGTTVHIRMPGP